MLRQNGGFLIKKCVFYRSSIQNVNDGIQIQVYSINKNSVNHFSQFILIKSQEKFKKISGSILGTVKKIDAQAKWRFSYKKTGS